jgi:hypothetical protein
VVAGVLPAEVAAGAVDDIVVTVDEIVVTPSVAGVGATAGAATGAAAEIVVTTGAAAEIVVTTGAAAEIVVTNELPSAGGNVVVVVPAPVSTCCSLFSPGFTTRAGWRIVKTDSPVEAAAAEPTGTQTFAFSPPSLVEEDASGALPLFPSNSAINAL